MRIGARTCMRGGARAIRNGRNGTIGTSGRMRCTGVRVRRASRGVRRGSSTRNDGPRRSLQSHGWDTRCSIRSMSHRQLHTVNRRRLAGNHLARHRVLLQQHRLIRRSVGRRRAVREVRVAKGLELPVRDRDDLHRSVWVLRVLRQFLADSKRQSRLWRVKSVGKAGTDRLAEKRREVLLFLRIARHVVLRVCKAVRRLDPLEREVIAGDKNGADCDAFPIGLATGRGGTWLLCACGLVTWVHRALGGRTHRTVACGWCRGLTAIASRIDRA